MKMKSCPFCGEEISAIDIATLNEAEDSWYFVQCSECRACGPGAETQEEAMQLWSKRK